LQESIARVVAEQLRVEITALTRIGDAPTEVIELYLAARRQLRRAAFLGSYPSAVETVASFDRCLATAPSFAPAIAALAMARLRCWLLNFGTDEDWEPSVRAAVERALAEAPDLAESHVAAGTYATQRGDYRAAAASLSRALAIAPTCPEALECLGMLQCEAGRAEEGIRRLRLAHELDPTRIYCLMLIARHHAFHGRPDECRALVAEMERRKTTEPVPVVTFRIRFAAWRGDREELQRLGAVDGIGDGLRWEFVRFYAQALSGAGDQQTIDQVAATAHSLSKSPRTIATIAQFLTELYAGRGYLDAAEAQLQRAVGAGLVDLEWLDRCPLLASLRERPAFVAARAQVRERAEAIWAAEIRS
jgi:tetratricopeptide (TPR) repeat protein